ncbi:MAG: STAS domain-containing protein [Myxococcales bacterium]|nr:STAS domain-containing protein [Myxococcales bacterium]
MGLSAQGIERRKRIAGLTAEDARRIGLVKDPVQKSADDLARAFFAYLAEFEEARSLLAHRDLAERARELKRDHLAEMVGGEYGAEYVGQRLKLAAVYSKAGLELRVFLGAFNHLLRDMGVLVMKHFEHRPAEGFEVFLSLKKLAFFDLGLIVDAVVAQRERTIRQQQEAIRELSTPVLQIRERLLLLPIIGVVDTQRARFITENLLRAVRANRARVVVIDVTGVAAIDSKVANHLLQTVTAARLMGATAIVTGLSSEVAQSLVALGIEFGSLNTVGDLQGGLEDAERILGYRLVRQTEGGPPAAR